MQQPVVVGADHASVDGRERHPQDWRSDAAQTWRLSFGEPEQRIGAGSLEAMPKRLKMGCMMSPRCGNMKINIGSANKLTRTLIIIVFFQNSKCFPYQLRADK